MTNRKLNLGRELLASVVVFLVALPLCMGIAIASGVPPALGLITGIIGGIVIGSLAGSPLQVSGPAAGLAVLVWQLVEGWGLAALGVAVLVAGGIQILAGILRIGRWFRAVSPAVIQGMLAGIGVLIFASQFHVMVDDKPAGGGLDNLLTIPGAIVKGLTASGRNHHLAAIIGLLTIGSLLAWNFFKPKKLKAVPGPLVAVVVAAGAAFLAGLPILKVDVPSNSLTAFNFPTSEGFALLWTDGAFVGECLAIALIASAETLLCATAVDRMHSGPRTNYDKELIAQGVGNSIAGIFGALPATGVIVRSSANVDAGATTRYSAIFHGFWLLGLVALAPMVLAVIPMSALAAILVYTGYKLVNPKGAMKLWRTGRDEFAIYLATIAVIVAFDLLTGVLVGIGLSIVKFVWTFSQLEVEVDHEGDQTDIYIKGAATFLRLPALAEALESVEQGSHVHLHIGGLAYVDQACHELLESWEDNHKENGGTVDTDWDGLSDRRGRKQVFTREFKVPANNEFPTSEKSQPTPV